MNEHINDAKTVLGKALSETTSSKLLVATSYSIEDQTLLHMLLEMNGKFRLFFLDTGRHYQETYDVVSRTNMRFGILPEFFLPDSRELETELNGKGPNAFYDNIDNRKKCCQIRKVNPLKRALSAAEGWICGLRQSQSLTRTQLEPYEWDTAFNLRKYNPLWNWSEEDVWNYINENNVPVNVLQKRGFRSIGCAPCTRAVKENEEIRAGRWWWENPEHKECGLHKKGS
jgi:phosphoadenosine phosphosulfate reductase